MRPGFGERHPALLDILASDQPAASHGVVWCDGQMPLRVSAHTSLRADLPQDLVTSVRCLVQVGDQFVMCQNRDGERHLVPGGHRIDGETHAETAVREVHEETGWLVRPNSIRPLGWLHFEILGDPLFPTLPHPDFLQAVVWCTAEERDGGRDADWTDIEGFETSSSLVSPDEARAMSANNLWDLLYLDQIDEK